MTVGLTDRALDLIGDVRRIDALPRAGADMHAGAPLATLHWEGFKRTARFRRCETQQQPDS
jgi:glycine cleavage system H lipoate-binding protein